jgi:hypothetical protein
VILSRGEQFPSLRREDGWDFAGTVVFTLALAGGER